MNNKYFYWDKNNEKMYIYNTDCSKYKSKKYLEERLLEESKER